MLRLHRPNKWFKSATFPTFPPQFAGPKRSHCMHQTIPRIITCSSKTGALVHGPLYWSMACSAALHWRRVIAKPFSLHIKHLTHCALRPRICPATRASSSTRFVARRSTVPPIGLPALTPLSTIIRCYSSWHSVDTNAVFTKFQAEIFSLA